MSPTRSLRVCFVVFVGIGLVPCAPGSTEAAEAKIRIVVFTPKDVRPPANIRSRMKQVVDYGQWFYGKWLQHWGYEPANVLPVDRDGKGNPVIYFVRGPHPAASGRYDKPGFQGQVREQAIKTYRIPRQGSTWWIFVYGTKLRASRGWGGHADSKGNGYTLLTWNDVAGDVKPGDALAGGAADKLNLKGYLHELGHTMSLPHIGPNDRHGLGMSLMGPNARTYRRTRSRAEQRVYITPAVAALIWKQPQMTGTYNPQTKPPRLHVEGLSSKYEAVHKRIRITGRLKSNLPAHSIVAIDLPRKGPRNYWRKSYASRLRKNGTFTIVVDEPAPSSGVLKVVFCFNNGVFTGTGKGVGFRHAIEIPYRYTGKSYLFGK